MTLFWQKIQLNFRWVLFLYLLLVLIATAQAYLGGLVVNEINGRLYTRYNNYIIFKQSFHHLLAYLDLYQKYPLEQWDVYKYSPTFSLLFGLLALQPDFSGLLCWNLINAGVLFCAVRCLPHLDTKTRVLILFAVAIELLTSLQNEQSNGLMAGLMILSFGLLERRHYLWATFCLVFSIYIKLFGLVAFALFLFYPHKWKLALYTIGWSVFLLVLPLAVVDAGQLRFLYQSWWHLLRQDHAVAYGLSVMGWLKTWFHLDLPKIGVLAAGTLLFLVPFTRFALYRDYHFRLLVLASVLVWVIIFNHMAESPSFVIAMSGVALWYFSQQRKTENQVLFVLACVFTMLSSTDLFPRFIRHEFFKPYVIKGVPCILVWFKLSYDLIWAKFKPVAAEEGESGIVAKAPLGAGAK
jgi:hypothetical protein